MSTLNLINDPFIDIKRRDGSRGRIAPWQLTEGHGDNPVVALAAPRADFRGALAQFLIGLLQCSCAPDSQDEWDAWLEQPPSPEELKGRLAPLADYFHLGGDGPRFMQDLTLGREKKLIRKSVAFLLVDSPGDKTIGDNTDHFVKRDRVTGMCPACAATALFTLQTNAPAGGRGNLTSLRGGGPLTTLAVLDPDGSRLEESLWRNLWLNVIEASRINELPGAEHREPHMTFPWLAATPPSEQNKNFVYVGQVHPLQMYWGMPRRIRLDMDELGTGRCDCCGGESAMLSMHYLSRPNGISYKGPWGHPLSPHYTSKEGEPLPRHPQPGGFSYRHWPSWMGQGEGNLAAKVISEYLRNKRFIEQPRLWVFGYDVEERKPTPRCWYETTVPLMSVAGDERRESFFVNIGYLIAGADMVAGLLKGAVKEAWFKRPGDVSRDTAIASIGDAFYHETSDAFYEHLKRMHDAVGDEPAILDVLKSWRSEIVAVAYDKFDYWAQRGCVEMENPRRIAVAHENLKKALNGAKLAKALSLPQEKKGVKS